jgi:hypothetical protein
MDETICICCNANLFGTSKEGDTIIWTHLQNVECDDPTPEPIALRIGNKVIETETIEMWMVECDNCLMLSGTHYCDGKQHPIGWNGHPETINHWYNCEECRHNNIAGEGLGE